MNDTKQEFPVYRPKHMSFEEIRDGCITLTNGDNVETRVCIAQEELRQGIEMVTKYPRSVTIYGSARLAEGNPDYERARRVARRIVSELNYAVITGGGPGIMEAANRGASEAGGISIGLTIRLPHEQHTNPYVNVEVPFYFFFTRKTSLSFSSEAYVAFPGGFGTFDETFELLTLMQTGKVPHVPLVFVGTEFWKPILDAVHAMTCVEGGYQTISHADTKLYTVTDDENLIMDIIRNAPERDISIGSDPSIETVAYAE